MNAELDLGTAVAAGLQVHLNRRGDAVLLDELREAASLMREADLDLQAGWAMRHAIHVAWGSGSAVRECSDAAVADFDRALRNADSTSLVALAALKSLTMEIGSDYGRRFPDRATQLGAYRAVEDELAQRLVAVGRVSPYAANYLVLGLVISWDFDRGWVATYPAYEVDDSAQQISPGQLSVTMPSAFHLFVRVSDWAAAHEVTQFEPSAFRNPGLRGWRAAVHGFIDPAGAAEAFAQAAAVFASDTQPDDLHAVGGHWTSKNVDLWARYFRARAYLARLADEPSDATELLRRAAAVLDGTNEGWTSPQVSCLRIVTNALVNMLTGDTEQAASAARQELGEEMRWSGEGGDFSVADQFLTAATTAFAEVRQDPTMAMLSASFPSALDLLGKITVVGEGVSPALRPLVAEKARAEYEGPIRTWVHRTLESITKEDDLRRLLLRLHQATLPAYAQIRHGPIEYGKDLVVLAEEDGEVVLRMYAAKVGDLTKPTWRSAQPELEEIFQVPLLDLQLPVEPTARIGVLVFNGHVLPHTEPVVEGWLEEQHRDHDRHYEIMNLDGLVSWIFKQNLLNELRGALRELSGPDC